MADLTVMMNPQISMHYTLGTLTVMQASSNGFNFN